MLQKEALNGTDRFAIKPQAVVEVVRQQMLENCDCNQDGKLDRSEMAKTKGYVFGTLLKTDAIEGVARTTQDMLKLNSIFSDRKTTDWSILRINIINSTRSFPVPQL
ncbi:hypothetical protein ACQCN2_01245 [Brevibacillus ginsengisoli]|uniref:hypothetical protein n=1 Tax=Brevibacillus ginsengisoli TaxID=363854 RepID=UPI003CE9C0CA